jgi:hypothetical protein
MMERHWLEELNLRERARWVTITELNKELWSIEEEYGESCRKINAIINKKHGGEHGESGETDEV